MNKRAFRRVPKGFRNVPKGFRNVPEGFRNVPKGFRNVPEGFRNVPKGFRNGSPVYLVQHQRGEGTSGLKGLHPLALARTVHSSRKGTGWPGGTVLGSFGVQE